MWGHPWVPLLPCCVAFVGPLVWLSLCFKAREEAGLDWRHMPPFTAQRPILQPGGWEGCLLLGDRLSGGGRDGPLEAWGRPEAVRARRGKG